MKYLLTILSIFLLSCSSTKKNISVAKTATDSTHIAEKKQSAIRTTDSISSKKEIAINTKETTIDYTPIEFPEDAVVTPLPGGGVVVTPPSGGRGVIYLPKITIKETGTATKDETTHLQKKDTTTATEKVDVNLQKTETVKQKDVKRFKFLPWYWAIIAAVVLFIYLKTKKIL